MFKNLVTLVTGGASGLGLGTVERFLRKGSKVIICDLPTSDGRNISEILGSNVQFIPADIKSQNEIKNMVDYIEKHYGQLNVVVNCAGICAAYRLYNFNKRRSCNIGHFQDLFRTNVIGTYNVIRATTKLMERNQPDKNGFCGVIVNTAGIEAISGQSGQVTISAASNAMIYMSKSLAAERKEQGIRVVTISPGLIRTALVDYFPPETENAIETGCFMAPNRMGEPDEFAHMVQTVVMSPLINGTNINIAGGLHLIHR